MDRYWLLLGDYAEVRGAMSIQDYYEEIRQDIAHEFGLEAGGYAPQKHPQLPIKIAQRIVTKYPHIEHPGMINNRSYYELNPKAIILSQRYMSIFGRYL